MCLLKGFIHSLHKHANQIWAWAGSRCEWKREDIQSLGIQLRVLDLRINHNMTTICHLLCISVSKNSFTKSSIHSTQNFISSNESNRFYKAKIQYYFYHPNDKYNTDFYLKYKEDLPFSKLKVLCKLKRILMKFAPIVLSYPENLLTPDVQNVCYHQEAKIHKLG